MATILMKNRQIAEEAADWAVRLDAGGLSDEDKRALAEWLLSSPLHVDELLISASIMTGLGEVDREQAISIDSLLEETAPDVLQLFQENSTETEPDDCPQAEQFGWGVKSLASMAAAIVLVVVATMRFWTGDAATPGHIAFETQTGEQRSLTLDDGSIVHVNTMSDIRIRYGKDERAIYLTNGEALFEVAHDPSRPFRVHAGSAIAEAVGTTFNVRRINNKTTVAVVEGKVAVLADDQLIKTSKTVSVVDTEDRQAIPEPEDSSLEQSRVLLGAGEQASVGGDGQVAPVAEPNMEAVTSWRMRKLVFKSDNLTAIASEFNRYNREQIILDDISIGAIELSGVFDADDPQSFVSFLEMSGAITVRRSGTGSFHLREPGADVQ